MIVGADTMQDKLRILNQVDGPQLQMEDDPRVNSVGRFLRATYIDEVPQFVNVLLGQMSVIGPRPSPGLENECVLPGVTRGCLLSPASRTLAGLRYERSDEGFSGMDSL